MISNYWMRLSRIWRILQGGCYPQRPKAAVVNTLWNLQNSSYQTNRKPNSIIDLLVIQNISPFLEAFRRFLLTKNNTFSFPGFLVNGSVICSGMHFWRYFDVISSIIFGGLHFWRHWFNVAKILMHQPRSQGLFPILSAPRTQDRDKALGTRLLGW